MSNESKNFGLANQYWRTTRQRLINPLLKGKDREREAIPGNFVHRDDKAKPVTREIMEEMLTAWPLEVRSKLREQFEKQFNLCPNEDILVIRLPEKRVIGTNGHKKETVEVVEVRL